LEPEERSINVKCKVISPFEQFSHPVGGNIRQCLVGDSSGCMKLELTEEQAKDISQNFSLININGFVEMREKKFMILKVNE